MMSKRAGNQYKTVMLALIISIMLVVGGRKVGLEKELGRPLVVFWELSGWMGKQRLKALDYIAFWINGPERIANLEQRLAETMVNRAEVKELKQENKSLLEVCGANAKVEDRQLARVLTVGEHRLLLRNLGDENIKPGMAVVWNEVMLGEVEEVMGQSLWVKLVGESGVGARVAGDTVRGIVKKSGQNLVLEGVWQSEDIKLNDEVITTGSELVPGGLLLGWVADVGAESSEVEREILITNSVDLNKLVFVEIVNIESGDIDVGD